jgi:zinc protease
MRLKHVFLGAFALILGVGAAGAQQLDMKAELPLDPDVRIGKLDNGMTYYIRHNGKPEGIGEFHIYHDVGSIQEEDSQVGLAHFLEHMAFNGTENLPDKQMIEWLESVGVKFGANLNAMTGVEQTSYMLSQVPLKREGIVDSVLLILHDWSQYISLNEAEIDKERGVIVEEFRQGNDAGFRIREKIMPAMYGRTRYSYRNIIGNEEHLRNFPYKELRDFYHRWYRPDMQAVVVVGDFDVDEMEAKVRKVMGSVPAVENPEPKQYFPVPDNREPEVVVATDPELTGSSISLYIRRPARPLEQNNKVGTVYENTLLGIATTLANNRFGEMTQKPNAPFLDASIGNMGMSVSNQALSLDASARENEIPRAFEAAFTEMERIRRYGFTQSELDRYKTNAMSSIELSYARRDDRRSGDFVRTYMNHFAKNTPMLSAEDGYRLNKEVMGAVTLEQVNDAIARLIVPTNNLLLAITPQKAGVTVPTTGELLAIMDKVRGEELAPWVDATVDEPLISHEVKGGAVVKEEAGMYGSTIWTLSNGVRVIVKSTDLRADQVQMSAQAWGGLCNVSDDDFLTAFYTAEISGMSGLGKFSRTDLAKALTGKVASSGASIGRFSTGINGGSSKKDVETMLQLTYLNFTEPRFEREQFDIAMEQFEIGLKNSMDTPGFKFNVESNKTMYGDTKRTAVVESLDRIKDIDFDRMAAIYDMSFRNTADSYTFYFIGDIDMEALKPLVAKYLGGLPVGAPKATWKQDGVEIRRGEITDRFKAVMETPKTTVSYLYTGDIEYNQKNSMVMSMLSNCLQTRYLESIREEKGGTYGVGVRGGIGRQPKPTYSLSIGFDTDPNMVDELLVIVEDEIRNIAENGPRAEDMAKTMEFWIKSRPESLKQNGTWLGYLQTYYTWGEDWNAEYEKVIGEVTPEAVQALARKIVEDKNLIKVIMDPQ